MSDRKLYRGCFVPLCTNTEIECPSKIFLSVPKDEKKLKQWFKLARRLDEPTKSRYYCCEDHFNLKEDMENYTRCCIMGGYRKLKENILPHIFKCHPNREITHHSNLNRPALEKLSRKRMINELLEEDKNQKQLKQIKSSLSNNSNKCETQNSKKVSFEIEKNNIRLNKVSILNHAVGSSSSKDSVVSVTMGNTAKVLPEIQNIIPNLEEVSILNNAAGSSTSFNDSVLSVSMEGINEIAAPRIVTGVEINKSEFRLKNEKNIKHFRSKFVSARPDVRSIGSQIKPLLVDAKTSPINLSLKISSSSSKAITSSKSTTSVSCSEYQMSTDDLNILEEEEEMQMKRTALKLTNYFISIDSKTYIGVPNQGLWILEDISKATKIPIDHIKLIFMKIKKDDTFKELAHRFGLTRTGASHIFNRNIDKIVEKLKSFIYCPEKNSMKKALPIPFRQHFNNVIGIIDCFEIEVEKPSKPFHQSHTWSEYKKCKTIKYLICISPDGLVIFISEGYAGRVSDTALFEHCQIMEILPENCAVMADRGFKQIQSVLDKKNIQLIRSPSVFSTKKSSKEEVIFTKRIASLRIHVERVIRRIREFSLLEPHSTIDHNMLPYINSAVIIATALINIQEPVIRT